MNVQGTKTALLVEPREAAWMLAVSPRKLWAMTFEESPGLPYVRCGRLVRYAIDDLRCWIDAQRKGGQQLQLTTDVYLVGIPAQSAASRIGVSQLARPTRPTR